MKILPFSESTFASPFSADYIVRQLRKDTSIQKTFRPWGLSGKGQGTTFRGTITGNGFKLERIIYYRNSFNPVIEGTVSDTENGAVIRLSLRPNTFVTVFSYLWLTGVSFATVVLIATQLQNGKFDRMSLVILAFWGVFFSIAYLGFYLELRKIGNYFSALCLAEH